MNLEIGAITIDCPDPKALVGFWSAALGLEVAFDDPGYIQLRRADGRPGPAIGLQRVPEPRAGKNRVHIDLSTPDRRGEVARLRELGATEVGEFSVPGLTWTVLQDPEGNEFCVGSTE